MNGNIFQTSHEERLVRFATTRLPAICIWTSLAARAVLVILIAHAVYYAFAASTASAWVITITSIALPLILEFSFTMLTLATAMLWGRFVVAAVVFFCISFAGLVFNYYKLDSFMQQIALPESEYAIIYGTLQASNIMGWVMAEAGALLIVVGAAGTGRNFIKQVVKQEAPAIVETPAKFQYIDLVPEQYRNAVNASEFDIPKMMEKLTDGRYSVDGTTYQANSHKNSIRTYIRRLQKGEGAEVTQIAGIARQLFIMQELDGLDELQSHAVNGHSVKADLFA